MYEILIVDDEVYAAQGIQSGIEWDKLDISHVHVAYNIRQAKEIYTNHAIHVMICDIEMPQGNGLELLAWVREHYPETKSLFLTCHAEFMYAKQAIQLGSLDYMLKPARFEDLEMAVKKAIDKIEKDRELVAYKRKYEHYLKLWSLYEPLLMERFWLDLLNHSIPAHPDQVKHVMLQKQIPYPDSMQFQPVLIRVQCWHRQMNGRDESIMEFALRDVADRMLLKGNKLGQMIQLRKGLLLAILPTEGDAIVSQEQLREDCQKYIEYCSRHFYGALSCYIGEFALIHNMPNMLEALLAYESNNVSSTNCVFSLSKQNQTMLTIPLPNMNSWSELLKQGCKQKLLAEIEEYGQSLKSMEGVSVTGLRKLYHEFLQMIYYVLKLKGLSAHHIFSENLSPEAVTCSVLYLEAWIVDIVERTVDYMQASEKSQTVVGRVKAYITQHINQDISRDDIANHVFLNPDYLTRLFKKETGLSISDYLLQERMKIAKELLMKTDMSVKDIALEVGYSNFSHFSKIFKKSTNMNPKDFRQAEQKHA